MNDSQNIYGFPNHGFYKFHFFQLTGFYTGTTIETESLGIVYKEVFAISLVQKQTKRKARTILEILGELGGLTKVYFFFAGLLIKPLSKIQFQIEATLLLLKVKSKIHFEAGSIDIIEKYRLITNFYPNQLYKKMLDEGASKLVEILDIY